ncbi:MAG: glycoside hydrolase family 99-like domain-containing protein [Chloroflexota bacterium]
MPAELARAAGLPRFATTTTGLDGKRCSERPFDEVSSRPASWDLPFALCWANAAAVVALGRQRVPHPPGPAPAARTTCATSGAMLSALADFGAARVDGKPLFIVYQAGCCPSLRRPLDIWRTEADRVDSPVWSTRSRSRPASTRAGTRRFVGFLELLGALPAAVQRGRRPGRGAWSTPGLNVYDLRRAGRRFPRVHLAGGPVPYETAFPPRQHARRGANGWVIHHASPAIYVVRSGWRGYRAA